MGRLIKPIGKYAEKPYHISLTERDVCCIEELCYVLIQDAYLLDGSVFCAPLLEWLDTECKCKEIADRLRDLIRKNVSPGGLAGELLSYARFGSEQQWKETERELNRNAGMSVERRAKNHADYLLQSGKYAKAAAEYLAVLESLTEEDRIFKSRLWNNRGVAFSRLFSYKEAEYCFRQALGEDPANESAAFHLLAVMRILLTDGEYVDFVAVNHFESELTMRVEHEMGRFARMQESLAEDAEDVTYGMPESEDETDRLAARIKEMKDSYREMIKQV